MISLRRVHVMCSLVAAVLAVRPVLGGGVTLDGSAGPAKSLVGPNFVLDAADGRQVGTALFHSMSNLSLSANESLTFTGPSTTTLVIARVTGGTTSQIDGTLATSGMPLAHLFLINPAGIHFGPTAKISVSQSFTATTADSVKLSDGTVISSTAPLPVLLTSAPPAAFGFTSPHQGAITVQGSTLAVGTGKSLALIAGSVHISPATVDGATQNAVLRARDGRVQIVAVGDAGTATVDATDDVVTGTAAALDAAPSAGALTMDAGTRITVDGAGRGRVDLVGQQINIEGGVTASTAGNGSGARIDVTAIGDIKIDGGGSLSTSTATLSPAGAITLHAGGMLTIASGGQILANTTLLGAGGLITLMPHDMLIDGAGAGASIQTGVIAQSEPGDGLPGGPGGNIVIQTHTLTVQNVGTISTVTFKDGNAGNINITADTLAITSAGQILAQTQGTGAGGAITVNATHIQIAGQADQPTGIIADTTSDATGAGGQITVTSQTLNIAALGFISTTTNGTGAGGGITVNANTLHLDGGGLVAFTGLGANSQSADPAAGAGGSILINAGTVEVLSGAGIAANTFAPGNGGDVTLNNVQHLTIDGGSNTPVATGLYVKSLGTGTSGSAGDVTVHAANLLVTRGGGINSESSGSGDGGNITLDGTSAIISRSGQITAAASGAGKAGSISLSFDHIDIDHASIAASATGTGLGGSVNLTATGDIVGTHASLTVAADHNDGGNLSLDGHSIFLNGGTINSNADHDGGSILLHAADRVMLRNSVLNAKAGNNGGSIHIDPTYVVFQSSDLTANAIHGNGGAILIQTTWYLPSSDSVLTVSSTFGAPGSIAIETPNPLITTAIAPLPVVVPRPDKLLVDSCDVKFRDNATSLLVTGSYNPSALPPIWSPVQALFGTAVTGVVPAEGDQ